MVERISVIARLRWQTHSEATGHTWQGLPRTGINRSPPFCKKLTIAPWMSSATVIGLDNIGLVECVITGCAVSAMDPGRSSAEPLPAYTAVVILRRRRSLVLVLGISRRVDAKAFRRTSGILVVTTSAVAVDTMHKMKVNAIRTIFKSPVSRRVRGYPSDAGLSC